MTANASLCQYRPLWPSVEYPRLSISIPSGCPPMHRSAAMVVFRGGGFRIHNGSGAGCVEFFAQRGVVAINVEYTTTEGPGPCAAESPLFPKPVQDAARAMRLVRQMAPELGVDPNRVGAIGFSAGGHLVALLSGGGLPCQEHAEEDLDHVSFRPDVSILCYPVISLLPELRGPDNLAGSVERLLGGSASAEDLEALSAELHVSLAHPPTFIWHTKEDVTVPVSHSEVYARTLQEKGTAHKLLIYDSGPHALGMALEGEHANDWTERMWEWLGGWTKPQISVPAETL